MSSLFFAKTFCVFVFVVCAFCEAAHSAGADETEKKINIFNSGTIDKIISPGGGDANKNIEIESFYSPVLLSTDDVIIAVIGGKQNPETKIDILTRYIVKKEDDEWINNAFKTDQFETSWKTQFVLQETEQKENVVKSLAAVAEGNKIYVLLVNHKNNLQQSKQWELALIEGNIVKQKETFEKITWQKKESSKLLQNDKFKENEAENYPLFFSAFVTIDKKVAFVVKSTKAVSEAKNSFFVFLLNVSKTEFKVLPVGDFDESCNPKFFLWGSKIIMIPTSCKAGTGQQIKQFDYKDERFEESGESVSRVWDFLKDKKDITTATINGTPAVLFTEEKQKASGSKKDIYLWVTDGSRLYKVRSTVPDDVEQNTVASLLYTKEKLFCLQQQTGQKSIILLHIKEQQEEIKDALKTWKGSDDEVQKLCAATTTLQKTCETNGLVGFLSNNQDGEQLKDEYLNVNAIITKEKVKVDDSGFTFSGTGARAVWPVGKTEENENQAYNFGDPGFTLVAPVIISGNANQTNSILGVVLKGTGSGQKSIGLWCSETGKWAVGNGEEQPTDLVSTSENCEQGETYFVVLLFNKNKKKVEVHIDGKPLDIPQTDITKIEPTEAISYFYFGADKDRTSVETHATIRYVLLYNRPLNENEIINLKVPKKEKATIPEETDGTKKTSGQQGDDNSDETKDKNGGGTEDKQTSSTLSSPTTEDSAVRVGVVWVLCFIFFGVFTLLGRYVY